MADRAVDFLLIGGGMASAHCAAELRKRGRRGLDPARRSRAGAALRTPAALEGVPARRGEREDAYVNPPAWYEENDVELLHAAPT